ncbi:hypothetical protein P691DRAFT_763915 [Macrolepiota fuliginosa MF-IS2]|uniref:DUF6533 domain-containing protein n=1 Tax=Macrolepiota fuliginosa MF-IS2 TaxID=1400762 RepID=A0A9P5X5N1_9AGAR|nr:hypothetical protein P691DRAFT_763915 [Macrolepiota fuliginosa MF-IS2]
MSTTFQHFLDKLLLGFTVEQVTTCINLASLTLLSYDWILNLSLEINLVWQSRRSLIKYLYLVTRYLAFGDVTILVYMQLALGLSAKKCAAIFAAFGWMFTSGFVLGELLLLVRTWAVWGRDRKLGAALLCFYSGLVVAIFVNMGFFLRSLAFMNSFPGIPGCVVIGSSNRLYVDWVLLMILDIGVCSLMIMRGYKSYISGGNSQLMKVVYGEGILYYVYLVVLSMINVILILRLQVSSISQLFWAADGNEVLFKARVLGVALFTNAFYPFDLDVPSGTSHTPAS